MKGFVGGSSRDIFSSKIQFSLIIYQVTRRIHVYALGLLELSFLLEDLSLAFRVFTSISRFCPCS